MAASSVTLSGTSVEVLTDDNYERWSLLMENYLKGKGLWDNIIESENEDRGRISSNLIESEDVDWRRRNAKALYAIQISCAPHHFQMIRKIQFAGVAWRHLFLLASDSAYGVGDVDPGRGDNELHRLVARGDWRRAIDLIRENSDAPFQCNSSGQTVLHVAVIAGQERTVEMLVKELDIHMLEMQDNNGYTALALVIHLHGNTELARFMVEKDAYLLTIPTRDNQIPLLLASKRGHRELTRYLYCETPKKVLTDNISSYGTMLFLNCITAQMFDMALELLQDVPEISSMPSNSGYDTSPLLLAIANMPNIFPSGCRLNWWQWVIYQLLIVRPHTNPPAAGQEITTSAVEFQRETNRKRCEDHLAVIKMV